MIKNYIEIKRTARYFQSKAIDGKIKHVVFVLHGYAQNADDFLNSFGNLKSEEILIIAPEGLSKFYWKDYTSNPTSSWMTSLERENEIKDNINYLNKVAAEIINQTLDKGIQHHLLGFSQGGATVTRFAAQSMFAFKNLFLYAGDFAHDLDWGKFKNKHQTLKFHLIYGTEDIFVTKEKVVKAKGFIEKKEFPVVVFNYEGKHKIEPAALEYIKQNL